MKEEVVTPPSWQSYVRLLGYLRGLLPWFFLSIFGFLIFGASQPALAKLMELVIRALEHKDSAARWTLPALAVGVFVLRRSVEHTSELQSRENLVCRLLLDK